MMIKIYKLGVNPSFLLRYFESCVNNEVYQFNEMEDLQLTDSYMKENKKIMSIHLDDDKFLFTNNIFQEYIIIDDIETENTKRNNKHSHIMLVFPSGNFSGNNYDKITLSTFYSTTEVDLTKNNEWIGILIPIGLDYKITFRNCKIDNQKIIKIIFNTVKREFGYHRNKEMVFDIDSFKEIKNEPDGCMEGDY